MNRQIRLIVSLNFVLAISTLAVAQPDSLIRFSDLNYHSDFEREAVRSYVKHKRDTFNLFLAIDETMSPKEAAWRRDMYSSVLKNLEEKQIQTKKLNKRITLAYSDVHDRFLKKYNENEYFPVIFQTGTYNCVSASMLYAVVFDQLDIPYTVKASSSHVYLVANPGPNSVVIETTNPGFEKQIFNGEFKQQYVNSLRTSKQISESEYKTKSVEEIFEEKFKEVRDAEFNNLPGFQYYNKALTKLQNNETEKALNLCQKAYFFYPDNQVKTLLHTCLLFHIEKCNFDNVTDIDCLAQLSRFEDTKPEVVAGIFSNILHHHLQYTDKEALCDSLNVRLLSQLSDKNLSNEIDFAYNLQMSYSYQNTEKVEKYVARALAIKGNHSDAKIIMENHLNRKLYSISNSKVLLDTINQLESRYTHEIIKPILLEHKLRGYLQLASDCYVRKQMADGDKYLIEFEKNAVTPIKSQALSSLTENTYRVVAAYYFYNGNKPKAKTYVSRGLRFVPDSRLLESAIY